LLDAVFADVEFIDSAVIHWRTMDQTLSSEQVCNLLQDLLDRPIAFHRCFAQISGSVLAGLMLSQAVYWSKRTKNESGWFWKTQHEWFKETFMNRSEQERARRKLREKGFMEEKRRGVPAKNYYRVRMEAVKSALLSEQARFGPPPNQ
jgi:hypothetical protein